MLWKGKVNLLELFYMTETNKIPFCQSWFNLETFLEPSDLVEIRNLLSAKRRFKFEPDGWGDF